MIISHKKSSIILLSKNSYTPLPLLKMTESIYVEILYIEYSYKMLIFILWVLKALISMSYLWKFHTGLWLAYRLAYIKVSGETFLL